MDWIWNQDLNYNILTPVYINSNVGGLPSLTNLFIWDGSQDFGSSLNNDGSLWFWPSLSGNPQPGSFQVDLLNVFGRNVTAVDALIEATDNNPSMISGIGVSVGGNWSFDTSGYDLGNGGTQPSPKTKITNKIVLANTLTANATMHYQTVYMTSGYVAAGNTLNSNANPTYASNPYFIAGNYLGQNPGGGIGGIAPQNNHVYAYADGSPVLNVTVFGDSTTAQIRPLASTNPNSKEGIWFWANSASTSANKNIRYYSFGQGAMQYNDFFNRLNAVLPTVKGRYQLVLFLVYTYNSPMNNGISDADTNWNNFVNMRTSAESLYNVKIKPLMLSPVGPLNGANNLAAWNQMRAYVSADGGIDATSYISSGTDIIASYSEDNVHINSTGASVQGPALHNLIYNMAVNMGWAI